MVVVDDSVGVVDGSGDRFDGVINDDVEALGGVLGCSTRVCVAVSVVLGVAWVMKSTVVVTSSVWASASSTKTAPRNSALA